MFLGVFFMGKRLFFVVVSYATSSRLWVTKNPWFLAGKIRYDSSRKDQLGKSAWLASKASLKKSPASNGKTSRR